jgi:hypothetical protein
MLTNGGCENASLIRRVAGRDQPWYGKSSWGHPDFDRKSVRLNILLSTLRCVELLTHCNRHTERRYSI